MQNGLKDAIIYIFVLTMGDKTMYNIKGEL